MPRLTIKDQSPCYSARDITPKITARDISPRYSLRPADPDPDQRLIDLIFGAGEQGIYYAAWRPETLYSDREGTQPAQPGDRVNHVATLNGGPPLRAPAANGPVLLDDGTGLCLDFGAPGRPQLDCDLPMTRGTTWTWCVAADGREAPAGLWLSSQISAGNNYLTAWNLEQAFASYTNNNTRILRLLRDRVELDTDQNRADYAHITARRHVHIIRFLTNSNAWNTPGFHHGAYPGGDTFDFRGRCSAALLVDRALTPDEEVLIDAHFRAMTGWLT